MPFSAAGFACVSRCAVIAWATTPSCSLPPRARVRPSARSSVVQAYLAKPPEIVTEDFPGYAPDANPDEGVRGYTKYHRLPNYAPGDTGELRSRLWSEFSALRRRPDLLASFIRHAGIPLRL